MTRYISLAEFVWLAEQVTGLDSLAASSTTSSSSDSRPDQSRKVSPDSVYATLTLRNACVTQPGMTMFAGLADPTRVRIVELLAEHGEMPAGRVAEHFDMTRAAVSRHLKTLEAGGFVVVREDAQRRLYRLNPPPFVEMDAWLARYRRFWGEKFATLHHHMEDDP